MIGLQIRFVHAFEKLPIPERCNVCRLDIPKAPLLLGQLLGTAIDEGSLNAASLQEVCKPIEDTEARRELIAFVFKTIQVRLVTLQTSACGLEASNA